MILQPVVYDGNMPRRLMPGDILASFEQGPSATDTTVTLTYTGANVLQNTAYVRNPAGASADTFPTADQLISTLSANLGTTGVPIGLSYRWRVINLSANLLTGAAPANAGVTMVRGNVPASTTKDFLIQVTNGTPLSTVGNLNSTNGSAVISGFTAAQLSAISVGQVVTNAVVGLQGTTVIAVNLAALTLTLSGNANATQGGNSITFSPTYTITGLAA